MEMQIVNPQLLEQKCQVGLPLITQTWILHRVAASTAADKPREEIADKFRTAAGSQQSSKPVRPPPGSENIAAARQSSGQLTRTEEHISMHCIVSIICVVTSVGHECIFGFFGPNDANVII